MENSNNKAITVSYMVAAMLVGLVASVVMNTIAAIATGSFGRFAAQNFVQHGFPVALGVLALVLLYTNKNVWTWADEVVTEIRRVVWPSRKDTVAMTMVVCVMVLLAGVFFGILDVTSGAIIDWLLHKNIFGIFG